VNIGIEGMMLASAFGAWYVASLASGILPDAAGPLGITLPLLVGLLAGLATGVLVSLAHAWLSVTVRADQIISGTIINIVALGITGYLALLISQSSPASAGNFDSLHLPEPLTDLPVLGWILTTFVEHGPITLSMLVVVIVLQVLLYRSRWGLRTRAVGEHPRAAETVGIDVIALRYRNVLLGGLLAGLAGAWFTIEYGNSFQSGMTNGRGFIALAALIFGRWRPGTALLATLLFGFGSALAQALPVFSPSGAVLFQALPYVLTLVAVAGLVGRSVPPAADGVPYKREGG
jgi:general nucleoside transport system permease protein